MRKTAAITIIIAIFCSLCSCKDKRVADEQTDTATQSLAGERTQESADTEKNNTEESTSDTSALDSSNDGIIDLPKIDF